MKKYRVIVCGTTYGQVYLSFFLTRNPEFKLAGIMANGSARSKQYAREFGVPLYTSVDEVPDDIDIACVVVRSTIAQGEGTFIAKEFLKRGINVIQEHPVHAADISDCLDLAESHHVRYHVNSHYVNVQEVRVFIDYTRKAVAEGKPLFIEATGSLQTLYSLFDIIGQAIGGFRPYAISDPVVWDKAMMTANYHNFVPFTCLQGVIMGIPITLKVQNYYDPDDFDNHFLIMHRVSIGLDGGNVTLVNTHGPVVWSQDFSIATVDEENTFSKRKTAFKNYVVPTAVSFTAGTAPSLSTIAVKEWPAAIHRSLTRMKDHIEKEILSPPGQSREYLIDLSSFWLDTTRRLGEPQILKIPSPRPIVHDPLLYLD